MAVLSVRLHHSMGNHELSFEWVFDKKRLNENLHVYIKASAGLTVWKLFHIGGMSEIYQIKYCEVTTKIIKISLYWQILENSSRNFSKIFIFRVVTQTVYLENSSNFFSKFQIRGRDPDRLPGKLIH